jgi:hypothetical protein
MSLEESMAETFRGIPGVGIHLNFDDIEAERDGLQHQQIHVDMELRLRQAGIKVLTPVEVAKLESRPYLYVIVGT